MSRVLTFNLENCIICGEIMGELKNELIVVTSFSERPIIQLIEEFTDVNFSEDVLSEAGICQNCFIKFNDYDEHQTIAENVKSNLCAMFEKNSFPNDQEQLSEDEEAVIKPEEIYEDNTILYETLEEDSESQKTENFFLKNDESCESPEVLKRKEQKPQMVSSPATLKSKQSKDVSSPTKDYPFTCDLCNRSFKERSKLKAHREIHTDLRTIVCGDCGKAFKTAACLRSHKRIHNPKFIYCDMCGKSYTHKTELSKHIRFIHYKIRDYSCDTCFASFGSKGHLATHRLTHLGSSVKNVICSVCSQGFHTRAKLDRHMKSHTGERNYACEICGKKFLYSYNVTAHIRHVHNREKRKESDRACSICERKFQKLWKLKEHLASVHNIVEEVSLGDINLESGEIFYEVVEADQL